MTFEALYRRMLANAVHGKEDPIDPTEVNPHQLDCLLHPDRHAAVWRVRDCEGCGLTGACSAACLFGAIHRREDGAVYIDPAQCVGCESCIDACKSGALTASRDALPALHAVKHAKGPVYALIAPAFHGQFFRRRDPRQAALGVQGAGL